MPVIYKMPFLRAQVLSCAGRPTLPLRKLAGIFAPGPGRAPHCNRRSCDLFDLRSPSHWVVSLRSLPAASHLPQTLQNKIPVSPHIRMTWLACTCHGERSPNSGSPIKLGCCAKSFLAANVCARRELLYVRLASLLRTKTILRFARLINGAFV